jgi:hypothetical protein
MVLEKNGVDRTSSVDQYWIIWGFLMIPKICRMRRGRRRNRSLRGGGNITRRNSESISMRSGRWKKGKRRLSNKGQVTGVVGHAGVGGVVRIEVQVWLGG